MQARLTPSLLNHGKRKDEGTMATKKLTSPIKIAEWRRSQTERVRIALEPFRGRNVIVLRTWWIDKDGTERAGRDGITLDVRHVSNLARAFKRARAQAKRKGLIDEE
jgi:hypothetical protein